MACTWKVWKKRKACQGSSFDSYPGSPSPFYTSRNIMYMHERRWLWNYLHTSSRDCMIANWLMVKPSYFDCRSNAIEQQHWMPYSDKCLILLIHLLLWLSQDVLLQQKLQQRSHITTISHRYHENSEVYCDKLFIQSDIIFNAAFVCCIIWQVNWSC